MRNSGIEKKYPSPYHITDTMKILVPLIFGLAAPLLSAQEIEELNLIKAMVTINPMGEPEDGDWGGGRIGRSNGGRSDGDGGDGRRSRSRHSRSYDLLSTPYWSLLLLEVAPRWRRRPRRLRARSLEVA